MFYLLLAILCSAAIALIIKWGLTSAKSQDYVLSGNYLSAFILAALAFLLSDQRTAIIVTPSTLMLLGLLSLITGILHYSAFQLYQRTILENGIAIAGAFAKMGILIPTVVSMVLWRELPTAVQSLGICLTFAALFYYYAPQKTENQGFKLSLLLLVLMVVNGTADFMTKVFQKNFNIALLELYLSLGFLVGFAISTYFAMKSSTFRKKDFSIGLLLGIPILLSYYFLILSLEHILATLAFPIFSAGSLIAITLGGMLFFKEIPVKKQWVTIGCIVLALVLINC